MAMTATMHTGETMKKCIEMVSNKTISVTQSSDLPGYGSRLIKRVGQHAFQYQSLHPRFGYNDGLQHPNARDGFLLTFRLLADDVKSYNALRHMIYELCECDLVQLCSKCTEPVLKHVKTLRSEHSDYDAKRRHRYQEELDKYNKTLALIQGLEIDTKAVSVTRPVDDTSSEIPDRCFDSMYSACYQNTEASIYADRTTEIWRTLVANGHLSA